MARRRKMSASQRKYFGRRSTRRAAPRALSRRRRSSGGGRGSGFIPLGMREAALDFGVGAITPAVNNLTAPIVDPYLNWAGSYKDEVRTALIGVAAYKLGSGLIKDAGREMFRFAVFSAGQQTGANFGIGTMTNTGGLSSGVVQA
jgi:hypothetical protein